MLGDSKYYCRAPYGAMLRPHPIPYLEYIGISHLRRHHASGAVNCILIPTDEFLQYAYVSVRVSVCMYLYSLSRIVRWLRSTIEQFASRSYKPEIECFTFSSSPGTICSKTLCPYLFAPRQGVCVQVSNTLRVTTEMRRSRMYSSLTVAARYVDISRRGLLESTDIYICLYIY